MFKKIIVLLFAAMFLAGAALADTAKVPNPVVTKGAKMTSTKKAPHKKMPLLKRPVVAPKGK